jgi:sulfite reductase (NADPH) flavoprotein alpha-component
VGAPVQQEVGFTGSSRDALLVAEDHFRRTGNELEGFLSEECGFLPRVEPELELPPSHRAWDEIAAALPTLWRDIGVRAAVRDLPPLRGTEDVLGARYVRRASTLLSVVAHSYVHSDRDRTGDLPPALVQAWDDIGRRVGKPEPFMRYEDLTLGNWYRPDPSAQLTIEDLRLLVPATGLETERIFYLTQVEIHARAAPIVGAVVRAQEAIARADDAALEAELLVMIETVRALTDEVLVKLDPNPYGPTTVDPILFGGIVADLAVPYHEHIPGPSGTAAPLFHVLDAFLGRKLFDSDIGVDAVRLRTWGTKAMARFVSAISASPGAQDILATGSRRLRGLVQTLIDAYSGPRGWLEAHRIKVYGFIEMSFKAGRPVTIGGFGGTFHDRPWRTVHQALMEARAERELSTPAHAQQGVLRERDEAAYPGAKRIVLDVEDEGIVYRPGDRCQVIPANTRERVGATVAALKGTDDQPVALTGPWRLALRQRADGETRAELPLAEFLTYARLRPLPRATAKALMRMSGSPALHAIVEARREDELGLRDAVALIAQDGYDVSELHPTLASIVQPEMFRHYAIVSGGNDGAPAATIELSVQAVEYSSEAGPDPGPRTGTASSFLIDAAPLGSSVPVSIIRPARLKAPLDDRMPIVVLADPNGFEGVRAIIDRAAPPDRAPPWSFVESADGIGALMRSDANAALLREVVPGAQIYVSGTDAFVQRALDALTELHSTAVVRQLIADRQMMFQVMPTHVRWREPGVLGDGVYDNSELALHNDAEHGFWLAVDGNVYDMTEFRHRHPGGAYIIDASAGMDASEEYAVVRHFLDPEINAMLAMYKVGAIRRVPFAGDDPLQELFRAWVRGLFLIVEMQNAFENDLVFQRVPTTGVEAADELTGLKLLMFSKAYDRFLELYYIGLTAAEGPLAELWRGTVALLNPETDGEWLAHAFRDVSEADPEQLMRVSAQLRAFCDQARAGSGNEQFWAHARTGVADTIACNRGFFAEIKAVVGVGVGLFETHEHATREHAEELLAVLRRLPGAVTAYRAEATALMR